MWTLLRRQFPFKCELSHERGIVRAWWPACLVLLLMLHVAAGSFAWFTPHFARSIASSEIAPEQGAAYVADVHFDRRFPYVLPADTIETPHNSKLALYENGRVLGPQHVLHADIRKYGGGRFSHWNGSIIFSTSDGSDPRTNGRHYSIASTTKLNFSLRIILLSAVLLAYAAIFALFRKKILVFSRAKAAWLLGAFAFLIVAVVGLAAWGVLGTLEVAESGAPKDAALTVHVLQHACLGVLVCFCIWAAGAGISRMILRDRRASLARILIPAFPVSLMLLAGLATISLTIPRGRMIALIIWVVCLFPLFNWRPPREQLTAAIKAVLCIIPFAIIFGIWLGLLWHGPTETLSGSPTGDITYYAGSIWSLADRPYPFIDLSYENGVTRVYFNMLFPALGAALLYLPGFDPFLFLLSSGGTSYILLSTLMLHLYVADRAPNSPSPFAVVVLVLSFLVAARYPYWVVESIPVVFVPALTIAVWWMAERGESDFRWGVAAMVAGLSGSALSKVATAAVLVPLGMTGFWRQFWILPRSLRIGAFVVGSIFGIYCIAMLSYFLPIWISVSDVGPESFRNPQWWFASRDIGALMLVLLTWLVADGPVAIALTIGIAMFLSFSYAFQINFVCVTLILGLLVFTSPTKFPQSRVLAFVAFGAAVPAVMLSDPAGISSSVLWIVCLGGAVLAAVSSVFRIGVLSLQTFKVPAVVSMVTLSIGGLGLIGVARGHIIADSGFHRQGSELSPELRDIWMALRRYTPSDALIFTDQVDETINVIGGWNTFALIGQRQVYVSSYYTSVELRPDKAKLREILSLNESVLRGIKSPDEVPTRSQYENVFAVVAASRVVPLAWKKIYGNKEYALFQMLP
jgi:hypothetical protein